MVFNTYYTLTFINLRSLAKAEEYAIPCHTANLPETIQHNDVDAVIMDTHAPFIIDAVQVGERHFLRKPFAAVLSKVTAALEEVKNASVKLQIGFNCDFDLSFVRIKQTIEIGEIGTSHLFNVISFEPLLS